MCVRLHSKQGRHHHDLRRVLGRDMPQLHKEEYLIQTEGEDEITTWLGRRSTEDQEAHKKNPRIE